MEASEEVLDELGFVFGDGFDGSVEEPLDAFGEPDDSDGVVGAGLVLVREGVGLGVEFGDGSGAALAECAEDFFESGSDDEGAGAEGAEESLVSWDGEEIDVHGLDIDGDVSDGLCAIDDEGDGHVSADAADLGDGLDGAGDVAGVEDGDEAGLGSDGAADIFGVDDAGIRMDRDA